MATETTKHVAQTEAELRHSALEELYRDERRPALLLLSGLVIAVLFFALGIMVGRWMSDTGQAKQGAQASSTPATVPPQSSSAPSAPVNTPASNTAATAPNNARASERRFSILIATYNTPEDAQPMVRKLEEAGYKDVRTSTPRAGERAQRFSVLVGQYTREEAEQLAARMRSTGDARLRNVRVIEAPSN